MAATQGFLVDDTELWMYQETASGESCAVGFDSLTTTFNINVSATPDAHPSDFPVIQIYPTGDIVFIPVGVFSLIGDMTGTNDITLISTTGSSSANSLILEKSRSGGVIVANDNLGSLLFKGHDGTQYITASQIKSVNSGTVATNRIASNLLFYTHPDSTTASTLRMTIAPAGNITIATPDSGVALTIAGGGLTSTGTTTLSSLTAGVVQTNSSGVISSSNGSNGQLLIGGGTNASWANITSSGSTITVTNGANTINLESSNTGGLLHVLHTGSGDATVSSGALTLAAGSNITTTGSGSTATVALVSSPSVSGSLTVGTGLTVTSGGISSTGTTTLSSLGNGIMRTNGSGVVSSTNGSNGQLLIGGGSVANWANITSLGGSVTITNGLNSIDIAVSAPTLNSFASDSGSAVPLAGVINMHGGSNLTTTAAGSTVTFDLDNTVSISGSMTSGTGFTATTGNITATAGNISLPSTNSAGTQGVINKDGSRWASNYGTGNIFVGKLSGNTSLTIGSSIYNSGFGDYALQSLTTGARNNAYGYNTLSSLTTGDYNTSNGNAGLLGLTTGSRNSTLGREAGVQLVTGNENLLLGYEAGRNYTGSESDNIILANNGTAGDNARIRIGTNGTHTACNIQGIAGVTVSSSSAVLINTSNGQLGTIVSARKYKKDINPIGKSSMNLLDLEPVQFKYIDDESDELHYGLIADDVANLYADLVVFNENHEPETVKYHELPALLLNELKRAMRRIDELERRLDARS